MMKRSAHLRSATLPRTWVAVDQGEAGGGVYEVGGSGQTMKVVFRKSAGISNPSEQGTYFANINFGENSWKYDETLKPRRALRL